MTCDAIAVTFDERWSSLFGVSQMTNESVSAKAEFVRRDENTRPSRQAKPTSARRGRLYRRGMVRHREWYKGGKKWRYVYTRRR